MDDTQFKVLDKRRNYLLEESKRLKSLITKENAFEMGLKLSPINQELKEINIKWSQKLNYHRYQILWECAKAYIPAEEREAFFKRVDSYLDLAIQNGQVL